MFYVRYFRANYEAVVMFCARKALGRLLSTCRPAHLDM